MALTTTWTQQSVVDFTAGTLGTISDCVTHVESKLQRGTLSTSTTPSTTEVQNELIRAKEELCEVFGFTWQRKYSYADTAASTYRLAMPADYGGGEVRLRDMTNNRFLEWIDPYRFDIKFPDPSEESNNKLQAFTIKDRELWVIPPPTGVIRLELEYGRTGEDSTATDVSFLPELMRFKICDYAIYQCFLLLHEYEKASLFKGEWMEGIKKSKRQSGKQKWAMSGFQALSWQQQYSARYYQAGR
jgi:hypothetical protein|tara:strand:- start:475 stop:1206 length:732 start_codon:yes stop_codon:yes gene_type:complete